MPGFRILEPLRGANQSTQYNAAVGYESVLDGHVESIGIEVGLRERTLLEPHDGAATTALLDPVTGQALVDTYPVACLSYREAMAEKLRAALCRRDVAIRDFFDIDYAVRVAGLDVANAELVRLLRAKLAVHGTGDVNVSQERLDGLRQQLNTHLRPVLRAREFDLFDVDRAFKIVRGVAEGLG